jgi:hypothetical protein
MSEALTITNAAAQELKDKLKLAFVEMLTEEQWDTAVKTEFDKFFKARRVSDGYNRTRQEPAEFEVVAREVMKEAMAERLREHFAKPEVQEMLIEAYTTKLVSLGDRMVEHFATELVSMVTRTVADGLAISVNNAIRGAFADPTNVGHYT